MAFKTLEKGGQELTNPYPKFEEIGDYVEGNISDFIIDDYGNKRIELYKGFDEESGEDKYQTLPAHSDLKGYYSQLNIGDYVHIELVKIIKSNNPEYSDKMKYIVQVDEEKAVEFGEVESDEE